MDPLVFLAQELKLTPQLVCEVGVGDGKDSSQVKGFIEAGVPAILIEALPRFYKTLLADFATYPRVTIHHCAIYKEDGSVCLYDRGLSTFISGVVAPTVVNDRYTPNESEAIQVPARTFDQFDPGSIDVLALDMEGSEYFALERLRSRPAIISLETTGVLDWGHTYVNPQLAEITRWMATNGFHELCKVGPDTIFVCLEKLPSEASA